MNEHTYERLGERLNRFDQKKPLGETFFAILRKMYTPGEAEVAAHFPDGLHTAAQLASALQKDEAELAGLLAAMAYKGTLFSCTSASGERLYELMPYVPGAIEYYIIRRLDKPDELKEFFAISGKFEKESMALVKKRREEDPEAEPPPAGFRIVPVHEGLPVKQEVFSFEDILQMIDRQTSFAAMPCTCRHGIAPYISGPCKVAGMPEHSCFTFGRTADYLVEQNFAQKITKEACLENVKLCNQAGLVQNVNNFVDDLQFLCNCCSCCCGLLKSAAALGPRMGLDTFLGTSNFAPVVDAESCIGCGNCEERCPVKAMAVQDGIAVLNPAMCLGCGQCLTVCPVECIALERIAARKPELGNRKVGFGF